MLAVAIGLFVGVAASIARSAGRSREHEVRAFGEAFVCSCGETFAGADAALAHAERRRDAAAEVEPPAHLGHPLR